MNAFAVIQFGLTEIIKRKLYTSMEIKMDFNQVLNILNENSDYNAIFAKGKVFHNPNAICIETPDEAKRLGLKMKDGKWINNKGTVYTIITKKQHEKNRADFKNKLKKGEIKPSAEAVYGGKDNMKNGIGLGT
jgi:hypothetical protein